MFISFEGIDGSGKSTQAKLFTKWLGDKGQDAVLTREPGGAPGAEQIRELLVRGDAARWSATSELLLFNAARRDHLEHTILPALEKGQTVICDRFVDSSRVYQGVARAELRQLVDALHELVIGRETDLTFILNTDPQTALARGLARQTGEDRFETLGLAFQEQLQAGFCALVEEFPKRCVLIDGNRPSDDIAREVRQRYEARL